MAKKVLLAVLAFVVVAGVGGVVWARSVLGQDTVRTALAAQLSERLGQAVSIEGIGATIYPRVTVTLTGVRIGDPARIEIESLGVGAAFRALLSRRIERATLSVDHARIELPLPLSRPAAPPSGEGASGGGSAVELVSIDTIRLTDVQIVSGGRTLSGDVEIGSRDAGFEIRRVTLTADGITLEATGTIVDPAGPVGDLAITAGALDIDQLLAFVSDFAGGAGLPEAPAGSAAPAPTARQGMDVTVALQADRATIGDLVLDAVTGRARATAGEVSLAPVSFGVFGGRYEGTLGLSLDETPSFTLTSDLSNIDVAAATAFAGAPGAISGRLTGHLELSGRGLDAAAVNETARGTVRLNIADGVVKGLGLVRAVVLATSMRADGGTAIGAAGTRVDEPFSSLAATLAIGGGLAQTKDLRLESKDLLVTAQGAIGLDGDPVNLTGRLQLSEQLTREGGTDLARYTQERGRVTLPVTIGGSAGNLSVRLALGEMMQRAIRNRANEETQRAIDRLLR